MQTREFITRKYIMRLPMILMSILIGFFDVRSMGFEGFSPLFYACYIYFFCGVLIGIELTGRRGLIIPGLIIMTLVLLLISRDKVLTVNILAALAVLVFILFILMDRIQRWAFPVFVLLNIVNFFYTGTENRLLVISLVVGALYSLAGIFRRDTDYRYIVMLALLLVVLLPIHKEPIKWTFLRNTIGKFVGDITDYLDYYLDGWFGSENAYSGYSGVGSLDGSVESDSKTDLKFKKIGDCKTLYLKGSDFSKITKDGFKGKERITPDYNVWYVTFFNALMNADVKRNEAVCFIKVESAEVKYDHLRTEDIIYPGNLLNIKESLENGPGKKVGRGFEYKLQYLIIDYASPYYLNVVQSISDNKKYHSYEEITKYTYEILKIKTASFMSKEKYDGIVERLKNGSYEAELTPYLDTSMSNERVQSLSQELTKDCKNNYEKAKVIEDYLRTYNYDTSVDLRDSDNYIDSFLFEEKRGYCVHFASAMVLLLRDAGVPARYVTGYLYEVEDKKENVMSSDAHAWVEAYIDGVGWMNFEPTASVVAAESWGLVASDDSVETEKKEEAESVEEETKEKEALDYEKLKERYSQKPSDDQSEERGKDKEKIEILKRILMYVLYFVMAAALLIIITIVTRKLWFHLLTPERKLRELVKRRCRSIEKQIESEDDIKELQRNDSSLFDYLKFVPDDEKDSTSQLFELYYKARFRGDAISESEIKSLLKGA